MKDEHIEMGAAAVGVAALALAKTKKPSPLPIETGQIQFDSSPDSVSVDLDGQHIGDSPLDVTDVLVGNHTYTATVNTDTYSDTVVVYPYKITSIKINTDTGDVSVEYIDIVPPAPTETSLLIQELEKLNSNLNDIRLSVKSIDEKDIKQTIGTYDNTETILTSVPIDPKDATSGLYQMDNIKNTLEANANIIYVYNNGPGLLYIVYSEDGIKFMGESILYEGEFKPYNNVYAIGARSPTKGLEYRVTERYYQGYVAERFSGSRVGD